MLDVGLVTGSAQYLSLPIPFARLWKRDASLACIYTYAVAEAPAGNWALLLSPGARCSYPGRTDSASRLPAGDRAGPAGLPPARPQSSGSPAPAPQLPTALFRR